ncbi:MAG TPA: hypothetical protein DCQ80_17410, partial [Pseudomonas sp.]|nr:hypothetical protein [Pseudomonas sp.]
MSTAERITSQAGGSAVPLDKAGEHPQDSVEADISASGKSMNTSMQLDEYQQTIRALSDRIVTAQTPVRVLDAVKWDDNVR